MRLTYSGFGPHPNPQTDNRQTGNRYPFTQRRVPVINYPSLSILRKDVQLWHMKFSDIPGLGYVKSLLTEAVKTNHAAHAQLFAGPPGALNLPLAIAYATYLHCENKGTDACGQCPACVKSLKFIHPDTHFVFPVSNIKNDKDEERFKAETLKTWRSFLSEQPFGTLDDWANYYGGEDKHPIISKDESREIIKTLSLKPFESTNKVMIIWQPEFMHSAAANGILKVLEEPSPNTFFLLVSNAADQLLPTILSRTQLVNIPLLTDDEVRDWLREHTSSEERRIDQVVQLADGKLSMALRLLEEEKDNNSEIFARWMRACYRSNYAELLGLAEEFHALDKLSQRNLMVYAMNMMRETLLQVEGAGAMNRAHGEELVFAERFGKTVDLEKIDRFVGLLNDASHHLERNGSAKMIFLDLSLSVAKDLKPNE